jgi:hypothetical protein
MSVVEPNVEMIKQQLDKLYALPEDSPHNFDLLRAIARKARLLRESEKFAEYQRLAVIHDLTLTYHSDIRWKITCNGVPIANYCPSTGSIQFHGENKIGKKVKEFGEVIKTIKIQKKKIDVDQEMVDICDYILTRKKNNEFVRSIREQLLEGRKLSSRQQTCIMQIYEDVNPLQMKFAATEAEEMFDTAFEKSVPRKLEPTPEQRRGPSFIARKTIVYAESKIPADYVTIKNYLASLGISARNHHGSRLTEYCIKVGFTPISYNGTNYYPRHLIKAYFEKTMPSQAQTTQSIDDISRHMFSGNEEVMQEDNCRR